MMVDSPYQLVQDFFHQQYESNQPENSPANLLAFLVLKNHPKNGFKKKASASAVTSDLRFGFFSFLQSPPFVLENLGRFNGLWIFLMIG